MIVDQNSPRGDWPLGRIVRPLPGSDGVVRAALVRTSSGEYVRPVAKLCFLTNSALLSKKLFLKKNKAYNSVRKEQQSEKVTDRSRPEISTVPVFIQYSVPVFVLSSVPLSIQVLGSSIHFKSLVPVFIKSPGGGSRNSNC